MFIRIVKMSFDEKHIETLQDNFHQNKTDIRNFEGCRLLELYRDKNDSSVFFTSLNHLQLSQSSPEIGISILSRHFSNSTSLSSI